MLLDSAIHFREKNFPWTDWQEICQKFRAVPMGQGGEPASSAVEGQWAVCGKGAQLTMVLVKGSHGGERFHWKIMLRSDVGDLLQNSWLKYAIPYEAMGAMDCVFSDYMTEEVKESRADLLVFAVKNLATATSPESLQQAGYMSPDRKLFLDAGLF